VLEELDASKEQVHELYAYLEEHSIELVGPGAGASELEDPARPGGRAEPRLVAPLPAGDRARGAALGRRGGRAGEADRAW
jgi:hypothetical protein